VTSDNQDRKEVQQNMKLVSFQVDSHDYCGWLDGSQNVQSFRERSLLEVIKHTDGRPENLKAVVDAERGTQKVWPLDKVKLLSPLPRPPSMRDGYAFRQHVATARRNRGLEMIPEFDLFPVFYFTNHQAVFGPGDVQVQSKHLDKLDFELEVAIVIGREGRNIPVDQADNYIYGYTIMNDWSARTLQMEEMKLNLGPAKGKDFATTLGPCLVTRDELKSSGRLTKTNKGEVLNATMKAFINGNQYSEGNVSQMDWTFAQIIERASYGVTLFPGDVIGSGTVGTGCLLELNGSKITDNLWLKAHDVVKLDVDLLGTLENRIVLVEDC
jgi:fumarylacetoacetate (FAA) hydrolase